MDSGGDFGQETHPDSPFLLVLQRSHWTSDPFSIISAVFVYVS